MNKEKVLHYDYMFIDCMFTFQFNCKIKFFKFYENLGEILIASSDCAIDEDDPS